MSTNELKKHEELRQLAIYVYDVKKNKLPEGWKLIEIEKNPKNGFYACLAKKGDEVAIAFRGTELTSIKDLRNDVAMNNHKLPSQAYSALKYYDEVKEIFPNVKISVTGHSLGGSLAQIVAADRNNVEGVTFNPYGTRDLFKDGAVLNEENVTNYCNPKDAITKLNGNEQIGKCYVVNSKNLVFDHHKAENMQGLETRKLITPEKLKNDYTLENRIAKPLINRVKNCVGTYYVQGYVRSDGTKVSGYERTCGAKHEASTNLKPPKSIMEMSEQELDELLDAYI